MRRDRNGMPPEHPLGLLAEPTPEMAPWRDRAGKRMEPAGMSAPGPVTDAEILVHLLDHIEMRVWAAQDGPRKNRVGLVDLARLIAYVQVMTDGSTTFAWTQQRIDWLFERCRTLGCRARPSKR